MRQLKWEVIFEGYQKRFVHAETERDARTEAKQLLPGTDIKYIRKCNRK